MNFYCALALFGPVYAGIYLSLELTISSSALIVATLLVAGVPLLLRTTGSTWAASMYLIADYVAVVTFVGIRLGGFDSFPMNWLALTPMLAVMLMGWRSAAFWAVIVVAEISGFYLLDVWGVALPRDANAAQLYLLKFTSLVGMCVSLMWLGLIYQRYRNMTAEMMEYYATHDPLTQTFNRRAVLKALQEEVDRSERSGEPVSVLIADLDCFKQINDRFGHLAGDEVLREASRRIKSTLRPYDRFGRFGGEEFLVVLPGCGMEPARTAAERIRRAVSAEPIEFGTGRVRLTISLGLVTGGAGEPLDAMNLLHTADQMLYQAKEAGRDRVEWGPASTPTCPAPSQAPDVSAEPEPALTSHCA